MESPTSTEQYHHHHHHHQQEPLNTMNTDEHNHHLLNHLSHLGHHHHHNHHLNQLTHPGLDHLEIGHHHHHLHHHLKQQQQQQQQQSNQQHLNSQQHSPHDHNQHHLHNRQRLAQHQTQDLNLGIGNHKNRTRHLILSSTSSDSSSVSPSAVPRRASRGKRVRTVFTPEQLKRLEQEFSNQMYLVGHDRVYLASSLKLSEAQVKVWFQNRRIKHRKMNPWPIDHQDHDLDQESSP